MPEEEEVEEGGQVFEMGWQRKTDNHPGRRRQRRSIMGDGSGGESPRNDGRRTSVAQAGHTPSPVAPNQRRPGRVNRGANVRQSQIVNMVHLYDDDDQEQDELSQLREEEEDASSSGEPDELSPDLNSSNPDMQHHKRSFKPALKGAGKVAGRASMVVAKTGASVAKTGGKASMKVAKTGKLGIAAG